MTGERNSGGDPTDKLVGSVAAIIAGKGTPEENHVAWLSMSQSAREEFYQQAERVIEIVRRSDYYKISREGQLPTGIVSKS